MSLGKLTIAEVSKLADLMRIKKPADTELNTHASRLAFLKVIRKMTLDKLTDTFSQANINVEKQFLSDLTKLSACIERLEEKKNKVTEEHCNKKWKRCRPLAVSEAIGNSEDDPHLFTDQTPEEKELGALRKKLEYLHPRATRCLKALTEIDRIFNDQQRGNELSGRASLSDTVTISYRTLK